MFTFSVVTRVRIRFSFKDLLSLRIRVSVSFTVVFLETGLAILLLELVFGFRNSLDLG